MPKRQRKRRLADAYRFPGCSTSPTVTGIFGDPHARIIALTRRSKKRAAARVGCCITHGTIDTRTVCAIYPLGHTGFIWMWIGGASPASAAAR